MAELAAVEEIANWEIVGGCNLRILLEPDLENPTGIESIVGRMNSSHWMTLDVRGGDWQDTIILWKERDLLERGKLAEKTLQEKLAEKAPQ